MEKLVASRLQRLVSKPLEFWPFQADIASDERAVRAARGCMYVGIAYAIEASSVRAGAGVIAAGLVILLLFGRPAGIKLDDTSLASVPNPAGNALVGDMTGRSPDIPQTDPSLTMTQFVERMQNPLRTDDYAIMPVPAPTEAHQVWGGTTPSSSIPQARQPAQLTYIPR